MAALDRPLSGNMEGINSINYACYREVRSTFKYLLGKIYIQRLIALIIIKLSSARKASHFLLGVAIIPLI